MAIKVAFDAAAVDWAALYAEPTDAANQFSTLGVSISALRRRMLAGTSVTPDTLLNRYENDRAKYGKDYLQFQTGTGATPILDIGYNGTTWDIGSFSGTFTAVLWVNAASSPADTFRIRLMKGTGTVVADSSVSALTSGTWTKFTVTGTISPAANPFIRFYRVSGTTDMAVQLTGAMIVSGSTAPAYFNCGTLSIAGNLTNYVMGADWMTGWVEPYQYLAPVGKATFDLRNDSKRFSPEYSSGALYGSLKPNLLVQVGDADYGIWWTGWTDEWKPLPGLSKDQGAQMVATDARRFFAKKMPVLPLITATTAADLPFAITNATYFQQPNTTLGFEENKIAMAWDALPASVLVEAFADNVTLESDMVKVLGDMFGALQGKFWFNRAAQRCALSGQGDDTPASYVDLAALWMNAQYDVSKIINTCEVVAYKRKTEAGSFTVWEMDDVPTAVAGLGTEVFRAFFKYSKATTTIVGADGLAVVETNSGAAGDITAALSEIGANSAKITFTNHNAASRNILTASITATTRVSQLREISKEYSDSTSITSNGTNAERLRFNYVQLKTWAKRLARYRVTRFKDPFYAMKWVEMSAEVNPSECYEAWVGAAVHITDAQTNHDDYYAVIGEAHKVGPALTNHTVKLYVEPLYPTTVEATSSA